MMSQNTCQDKKDIPNKKYKNLVWPLIEAIMGSMTHEAFAKKVGMVQRNYLSNYKSGRATPSEDTIDKIIEAFNLKPPKLWALRQAATDDRNARREDNAAMDLLIKERIERTRTEQQTQIDTISGDPSQLNPINEGEECMIGGSGEADYRDEWAILMALTRLGISRETRGLIVDELEALERHKSGRMADNFTPEKKRVNDAKH